MNDQLIFNSSRNPMRPAVARFFIQSLIIQHPGSQNDIHNLPWRAKSLHAPLRGHIRL